MTASYANSVVQVTQKAPIYTVGNNKTGSRKAYEANRLIEVKYFSVKSFLWEQSSNIYTIAGTY